MSTPTISSLNGKYIKKMKSYLDCMETSRNETTEQGKHFEEYERFDHIYELTPRDMQTNVTEIKRKIKLIHENTTGRQHHGSKSRRSDYPFHISQCLPLMIQECNNSSIIAVKSIRFLLDFAIQLQKEMPHLHIIHYSRDPRGIINSRYLTSVPRNVSAIPSMAERLCNLMVENMEFEKS